MITRASCVAIGTAMLIAACATATTASDGGSDALVDDAHVVGHDGGFGIASDANFQRPDTWVDPNLLRLVWPPPEGRMLVADESLVIRGGISPVIDICADSSCVSSILSTPSAAGVVAPTPRLAPGRHWWRAHDAIGQATETQSFLVVDTVSFRAARAAPRFDVDGDGRGDAAVCLWAAGLPTGHRHLLVWTMGALGPPIDLGATADACGQPFDAGDVNGDGRSDVGNGLTPSSILLGDAQSPLVPTISLSAMRTGPFRTGPLATAPVGDIDGDGLDDLVVTYFWRADQPCWSAVLFGDRTEVGARQLPIGPTVCDWGLYGFAKVAPLGVDVDANGMMDVVFPTDATRRSLSVFSPGGEGTPLFSIAAPALSHFGSSLAPAGDVDADGAPDLVVTQFEPSGVRIVSWNGRVSELISIPVDGHERLVALGDFDGDGVDDVALAGSPGAYVLYGGASGTTLVPIATERMGFTHFYDVAAPGDVTGDAIPDLIVSGMPGDHVVLIAGGGRDLDARGTVLTGVTGLDEYLASR
jgi:hypothetical protein